MIPENIIRRPVLTEKTTRGVETRNTYVFEVAPEANKITIRRAIEQLFNVKVSKVNVRNRKGKLKRVGRSFGYGKGHKEAIVTLKEGYKLDVY